MFRALALVFAVLAAAILLHDAWPAIAGDGGMRLSALGEWWFRIDPGSLQALQPAIERHVSPVLWSAVAQPLLEASLAIELAVLAVLCWLLRRRQKKGRGDRRGGIDLTRR